MMATTLLPPDHNIELKCRICAMDFKISTEGVPIFKTEQLLDKIKIYLHINVSMTGTRQRCRTEHFRAIFSIQEIEYIITVNIGFEQSGERYDGWLFGQTKS